MRDLSSLASSRSTMLPPPCSVSVRMLAPSFLVSSLLAMAGCHFARALKPPMVSYTVRAGTGSCVDRLTLDMLSIPP
ncbi:MAG TPA: hypothetical protein VE914_12530 [Candidatus Angelobacter sp.]|nr:hypothetical protein [Candidatus Angelobacter sp.]